MLTLAQWVSLSENRSAFAAVERVADCVASRSGGINPPARQSVNPLFLHGPAGVGKTHLVAGLAARVVERRPGLSAVVLTAGDFDRDPAEAAAEFAAARQADLVAVEDVHRLSAGAVEPVVQLLDFGLRRRTQFVFTAAVGPALLERLPARLTSRLASGLIVGMEAWSPTSRLLFLQDRVARRGMKVEPGVLEWLADHVSGSGRQLDGAVGRLEALTRLHGRPPEVEVVAELFRTDAESRRATVERIAQGVGRYFRVEPRRLQERDRSRQAFCRDKSACTSPPAHRSVARPDRRLLRRPRS